MFNDAINDGLHPGPNPFANLRLGAVARSQGSDRADGGRADELAETALDVHGEFGPTFRAMILFAAYVGLRPGELFALERARRRAGRGDDPSEPRRHGHDQGSEERSGADRRAAAAGA